MTIRTLDEFQAGQRAADDDFQESKIAADDEIDEEEEEDQPKAKSWTEIDAIGSSDLPDALNFPGVLTSAGGRAGTVDVGFEIKVRGAAEPALIAQLAELLGDQAFTVKFAGQTAGDGGVLRTFRCAADADGDTFCDVTVRLPQSAASAVGKLNSYLKKGAILALEPQQMTLDLTKRA